MFANANQFYGPWQNVFYLLIPQHIHLSIKFRYAKIQSIIESLTARFFRVNILIMPKVPIACYLHIQFPIRSIDWFVQHQKLANLTLFDILNYNTKLLFTVLIRSICEIANPLEHFRLCILLQWQNVDSIATSILSWFAFVFRSRRIFRNKILQCTT